LASSSLIIANIHAGYGAARVLEDVSLRVGAGETVALLGINGERLIVQQRIFHRLPLPVLLEQIIEGLEALQKAMLSILNEALSEEDLHPRRWALHCGWRNPKGGLTRNRLSGACDRRAIRSDKHHSMLATYPHSRRPT
jgi:hypothetical protein